MRTPWLLAASAEMERGQPVPGSRCRVGNFSASLLSTASTLWLKVVHGRVPVVAIRLVYAPDQTLRLESIGEAFFNIATSYGRARIELTHSDVVRAKVSITP